MRRFAYSQEDKAERSDPGRLAGVGHVVTRRVFVTVVFAVVDVVDDDVQDDDHSRNSASYL